MEEALEEIRTTLLADTLRGGVGEVFASQRMGERLQLVERAHYELTGKPLTGKHI